MKVLVIISNLLHVSVFSLISSISLARSVPAYQCIFMRGAVIQECTYERTHKAH